MHMEKSLSWREDIVTRKNATRTQSIRTKYWRNHDAISRIKRKKALEIIKVNMENTKELEWLRDEMKWNGWSDVMCEGE